MVEGIHAHSSRLYTTRTPRITIHDLPTEMMKEIFANLDFASQICLGLTCKIFGSVLEMVNLRNTGPQKLPGLNQMYGPDRHILLRQLSDWMPQTHIYCRGCCTYFHKNSTRRMVKFSEFGYARSGWDSGKDLVCIECAFYITWDMDVLSDVKDSKI
jgi:hypothetical protein